MTIKPYPYAWKKIGHVPNGHRFWRDEKSGRVAISDQSGHYPDDTEDGVLWLDPSRLLKIDLTSGSGYTAVHYPVLSERNGKPYSSGDGVQCLVVVLPIWLELGGKIELYGAVPASTLRLLADAVEAQHEGAR